MCALARAAPARGQESMSPCSMSRRRLATCEWLGGPPGRLCRSRRAPPPALKPACRLPACMQRRRGRAAHARPAAPQPAGHRHDRLESNIGRGCVSLQAAFIAWPSARCAAAGHFLQQRPAATLPPSAATHTAPRCAGLLALPRLFSLLGIGAGTIWLLFIAALTYGAEPGLPGWRAVCSTQRAAPRSRVNSSLRRSKR